MPLFPDVNRSTACYASVMNTVSTLQVAHKVTHYQSQFTMRNRHTDISLPASCRLKIGCITVS